MKPLPQQWFEDSEQYTEEYGLPAQILEMTPPLVRVYPGGATQPGWGAKEFEENFYKGRFDVGRSLPAFDKYRQPFGLVMRGVPLICVDIDGKNDGINTARVLHLPKTLGEVSKSGNGYHLFYSIPGAEWIPGKGYDEFPDIIGLIPGVDVKGTGIVYHYPQQRWNRTEIAVAPRSLLKLLSASRDSKQMRLAAVRSTDMDDEERAMLHDQIRTRLKGRFEAGNINNKLFAIGAQMLNSGYPNWQHELMVRGLEVGSTEEKMTTIINNVIQYT